MGREADIHFFVDTGRHWRSEIRHFSDLLRQNAALERGVGDAWRKAESIREEEERKRRQLQQELQQIRFEQQQPLMSAGYDMWLKLAPNPPYFSPSSVAGAQQWMQVAPQPLPYSQPADPFAGPQLVQRVRKLAETARWSWLLNKKK